MPLVLESHNWAQGVLLGAIMGAETTAAATGAVGVVRRDPMAMLPFCGYNMADYFGHWLNMGKKMKDPPKIFFINWFRKDEADQFLWPGFGDNIRALNWAIRRAQGDPSCKAAETPIGRVPRKEDLDLSGLNISAEHFRKLVEVDRKDWEKELQDAKQFLEQFGSRLPAEIWKEFNRLKKQFGL